MPGHLLVKSAFFGQIAYLHHVFSAKGVAIEAHLAAVGSGDAIDDADECGLACSVGSEQTEHLALGHTDAHAVERGMLGIAFHHVVYFQKHFFHSAFSIL